VFGENVDPVGQMNRIKKLRPFYESSAVSREGSGHVRAYQDDILLYPSPADRNGSRATPSPIVFQCKRVPDAIADVQKTRSALSSASAIMIAEGKDDDFEWLRDPAGDARLLNANNGS